MIKNGYTYKQKKFPHCEFMVLMLGFIDGEIQFCRVADYPNLPLVMTDGNGQFMYSEKELHGLIKKFNYSRSISL